MSKIKEGKIRSYQKIEKQTTFYFELVRLAQFLRIKWLAKLADGKIIARIYVDGKPAQGIKYVIK